MDIGAFEVSNTTNGGNFVALLPKSQTGSPYNFTLVPNNGAFTYSQTGGTLPSGIALTTSFSPNAVIALGGITATGGIYNFAVTATDGVNSNITNYRVQFLAPTAAGVSIAGRVLNGKRGLANAIVVLTKSDGTRLSTRTGSFGYYRFDEIAAGQTVIVEIISKRFSFAPQVVNVNDNVADLDFIASQE